MAAFAGVCVVSAAFGVADAHVQGGMVGDLSLMCPEFVQVVSYRPNTRITVSQPKLIVYMSRTYTAVVVLGRFWCFRGADVGSEVHDEGRLREHEGRLSQGSK